jgi:hypothetical protein
MPSPWAWLAKTLATSQSATMRAASGIWLSGACYFSRTSAPRPRSGITQAVALL